jgi:hypothetical protein
MRCSAAAVLPLVPPLVELVHEALAVCVRFAGGRRGVVRFLLLARATPRRRDSEQHTGKHDDEPKDPDQCHLEKYSNDQADDADNRDQDAQNDGSVRRSASVSTDRGDEIAVIVIETALHLFEEALLVL